MERTRGRGLDVILDSVGGEVRSRGFEVLAPLGRLVAYGNACDDPEIGFPGGVMRSKLRGMLGFSTTALAVLDPPRARGLQRPHSRRLPPRTWRFRSRASIR